MTRTQLQSLRVTGPDGLRNVARTVFGPASWIASASKHDLVEAIFTGLEPGARKPAPVPDAPSPAQAPVPAAENASTDTGADSDPSTALVSAIQAIAATGKGPVDEDRVREIAEEAIKAARLPQTIEVKLPGAREAKDVGRQHEKFADLLAWVQVGKPVLLVGPAGSGKTTAGKVLAKSLGAKPLVIHLGPQTTQASLFGYTGVNGEYVPSQYYKAYAGLDEYADGAVIVLDEIDRCNPRVAVTLNGGLENGSTTFPCGPVPKGEKTIIIAGANTLLDGADRQYVSAAQQDAAFKDRFVILEWGYDEGFERDLAIAEFGEAGPWVDRVQAIRRAVATLSLRHLVSPRASIVGARALAAGIPQHKVEAAVLWKGLDPATIRKIEAEV